jgi:hypothetical protein
MYLKPYTTECEMCQTETTITLENNVVTVKTATELFVQVYPLDAKTFGYECPECGFEDYIETTDKENETVNDTEEKSHLVAWKSEIPAEAVKDLDPATLEELTEALNLAVGYICVGYGVEF